MRHRRALAVTPPVLFLLVSLLHPLPDWAHIVDSLAPRWTLWMAVHVAQLVLVPLLVFSVWMLLGGLTGRLPGLARAALIVFAAFYSAFDTIVGLGTGLLVRRAMLLDGAEREAAARLAQWFWDARLDPRLPVVWVIAIGTMAWLIAMIATALALRRAGAPRRIAVLLIVSGLALAIDHPFPTGTIAMFCLMIAISLRERTRYAS
ncbi:MAG TPA: hypothetical protein VHT71_02515 [Methylomirabilota bacterium]|jgi:hypothetical protein|nr:hypothetical protein [Methylomirabilota bacterium]